MNIEPKYLTASKKSPLYINYAGSILLETPLLNKGSAFSESERRHFNLDGLLPIAIESIEDQEKRVVFVGAGSAGCGITNQIVAHMIKAGLTEAQALSQVFLTGCSGLLTTSSEKLHEFQKRFAKDRELVSSWVGNGISINLLDVVRESKSTYFSRFNDRRSH